MLNDNNVTLYASISYDQWQSVKRGTTLIHEDQYNDVAHKWFAEQVVKKTRRSFDGVLNISWCAELSAELTYCFFEKPTWLTHKPKHVIIKLSVEANLVVPFDDHGYVHVVNDFSMGKPSFYALDANECREKANASPEECIQSYDRIFDVSREYSRWCGRIEPRAFVPFVGRCMVKKAWVYKFGRRLRRKAGQFEWHHTNHVCRHRKNIPET